MPTGDVYKVVVLPDLQIPFTDAKSLAAVEAYIASERWDEWLQIGDFMDFDQISRWNEERPEALIRSLAKDYEVANDFLDRHQSLVRKRNPNAKFTILAGNHDIRPDKFADKNPQLKGLVEIENCLRFAERGIKYVRCYPKGEVHKIGKAHFIHGLYTSANHAKKHVESFGVNVFYGHTHDIQMHSKVLWGKGKSIVGQSLGCLCRYDLDYVGQNPKNWQHAVATFYFLPDGHFSYYVSRIHGGRFVAPNGKVYHG